MTYNNSTIQQMYEGVILENYLIKLCYKFWSRTTAQHLVYHIFFMLSGQYPGRKKSMTQSMKNVRTFVESSSIQVLIFVLCMDTKT